MNARLPDKKKSLKILSPTAILGYGFPAETFSRGLSRKPDLIAVDAGSTDPGPYYLGSGKSFTNRLCVKRDLSLLLEAAVTRKIPLVIGSAGGCGAAPHLEWCRKIIEEIASEKKLFFRIGIIAADIEKEEVLKAFRENRIKALPGATDMTEETVAETIRIVGQMGFEPIIRALDESCDVVLAGRCYDPAVFAAFPISRGFDPGPALHLGKILECAAIAATPGSGSDCVLGTLYEDCFSLEALQPKRRFTAESTAAHTLYEKSDPYHLPGPGGVLNLKCCTFKEYKNGKVEVRGSSFEPSDIYTIKLEGAVKLGFRAVSVAGIRDPILINKIDETLSCVREQVESIKAEQSVSGEIYFHVYGKNGVMGKMEPVSRINAHELGLVIESRAPTQTEADTLCSLTRSTLLHYGYPGRISTAGNLAFPFSPSDISMGDVYGFSVYHLLEIKRELETIFPVTVYETGDKKGISL